MIGKISTKLAATALFFAALAVVWTVYAINTKEGDEIISKVVTGKR